MTATFSPCGVYRYTLTRSWLLGDGRVLWMLLNPSTADATVDDPTMRRCIRFSQAWGFSGMTVVNIFAIRSTDPRVMLKAEDPVGPGNDAAIADAIRDHEVLVAGWGAHGSHRGRDEQVLAMCGSAGREVHCLALTKGGHPRHPLYVRGDTKLMTYREVEVLDG